MVTQAHVSTSRTLAAALALAAISCGPSKPAAPPTGHAASPQRSVAPAHEMSKGSAAVPTSAVREFEVLATTFNPKGPLPPRIPVLPVTYDPRFQILLRVDQVLAGPSPFPVGQQLVLLIHSPTLLYGGYGFDKKPYAYRFRETRASSGATYDLLHLDTWPRSQRGVP
jgi:hypothetical protein